MLHYCAGLQNCLDAEDDDANLAQHVHVDAGDVHDDVPPEDDVVEQDATRVPDVVDQSAESTQPMSVEQLPKPPPRGKKVRRVVDETPQNVLEDSDVDSTVEAEEHLVM